MAFADMKIGEFCEELGSKAPVPGGGGAAGLVGAIGAALGQMVCSLTEGKAKYAEYQDELVELIAKTKQLRLDCLALTDEDALNFEPLSKAYGIPKDDPTRDEVMEKALKLAVEAPVKTMETLAQCIDLITRIEQIGTPIAISDAGVGALCCETGLKSAALNIFINTKLMKDRAFAEELDERTNALLDTYCPRAEETYERVLARIR